MLENYGNNAASTAKSSDGIETDSKTSENTQLLDKKHETNETSSLSSSSNGKINMKLCSFSFLNACLQPFFILKSSFIFVAWICSCIIN